MKEDHNYYRGAIETSKRRLAELEGRGIEALSSSDIEIAYGGDAQLALDEATLLVSNHIIYDRARLAELGPEVRQLDLFGRPLVSDVFDASALGGDAMDTDFEAEIEQDFEDWDDEEEESHKRPSLLKNSLGRWIEAH